MSNTSQSLLNVFENMNESITMQYGDSTECGYKKIEVQQIIINKKDLLRIAQALTEMENSELFNGES